MKEDIFSKFKDFNNELEKILEKKDFSKDSKNLLLSMFYKLEISYSDYEKVKRKVKTKQEYLENILENIKYCNGIELIKPNTEEFNQFINEDRVFDVDLKLRKIKVIDNEISLLSSILELNNFKIYLDERYNLIRNSFPYILNTGNDMDNIEVLRDFNAFSWNINEKEIENIYVKLVYENLKFALSQNIIRKIEESEETFDLINFIKEDLNKKFNINDVNEFLNILFKLSIIIYINKSEIERKRLSEEKKVLEEDIKKIENKKGYINEIIDKKIYLNKQLKNLDLILNNNELLLKEFNKRNEENSEHNKLFNIKHLKEKLIREREKNILKIEECNLKLDPKIYIENKTRMLKDFSILENISFEEGQNNFDLYSEEIKKLQIIFIEKFLPNIVNNKNTKEELIDTLYQIRYYNFIPLGNGRLVFDDNNFKELIEKSINILLEKMYELRIINNISTNKNNDIEIVKNILFIKTINLEDIYLELIKDTNEKYQLRIYDGKEILEKTLNLNLLFNKKDRVKLKKQIKLFK